jgi:hypothetical protein
MRLRYVATSMLCVLLVLAALPALARPVHGWIDECPYSHSGSRDPFHLGRSGEVHDFFGARTTDGDSTIRSMRRGGTTCQPADTAGYWVPALYENGRRILPAGSHAREQVYYRDNNLRRNVHVRPFPRGMALVAGNPRASSRAQNPMLGKELYWGCSNNRPGGPKRKRPISCKSGIISLHVGFPNCWNGRHRSMVESPGSVVYPVEGSCPVSHPIALPRLIERWEYPVGTRTGHIRLSSGPAYSVYGAFWNTWKQGRLEELVRRCLNGDHNCGTFGR